MKNEERTFLNPRHKIVQLSRKRGDFFFLYCINKGEEIERKIQTVYPLGKGKQIDFAYPVCTFIYKINGYYAFIKLNISTVKNKAEVLNWSNDQIEKFIDYYVVSEYGLSINNNF